MSFNDELKEEQQKTANTPYYFKSTGRPIAYSKRSQGNLAILRNAVLGVLLMAIGCGLAYLVKNEIGTLYAPKWTVYVSVGIFFGVGFFIFMFPMLNVIKLQQQAQKNGGNVPEWLMDYNWDTTRVKDNPTQAIKTGLFVFGLYGAFMVLMVYFAFFSENPSWVAQGVVILFMLALIFLVFDILSKIKDYFKYGHSSLLPLTSLPFYIGEELSVNFVNAAVCHDFNKIHVVLQLIQEEEVMSVDSEGTRSRSINFNILYRALDTFPTLGEVCPITMSIPANCQGNHLSGDCARYWVLDVTAHHLGRKFSTTFLLPVYEQ